VNFFDTANMYSNGESERVLGEALEGHREESVVATKAYFQMAESNPNSGGLSRKAIEQELEHSLDRLGMETIDLYQLHRWDDDTPIEETLAALDDAVRRGKVRHVGASSMWAHQFAEALHTSDREGVRAVRHHAEPLQPRLPRGARETLPLCQKEDRRDAVESAGARVPHAPPRGRGRHAPRRDRRAPLRTPLPRGRRAGGQRARRRTGRREGREDGPDRVGVAVPQKEWVDTPIVGTTSVEHLEDAVEALDIDLSKSDMEWLEEPYEPVRVSGHE